MSYKGYSYHPHQTYICELHPAEFITNFCQCIECLVPLCPICIIDHFQMHQSKNTSPDIESIANAQQKCDKKLNAAVKTLQKELDKAQLQSLTDPEHMIQRGVNYIEKVKDKVLTLVDQYFTHLENNLKQKVHENQNIFKTSNFEEIVSEVNQLLYELKSIGDELHSPYKSSIISIKNIMLLDLKTLMEKFKNDIKRTVKNLNLSSTKVIFDESKIHDFREELERLVFIEHQYIQNHHPMNKQRSQTEISPIKYIQYPQNPNKSFQNIQQIAINSNYQVPPLQPVIPQIQIKISSQNYFNSNSPMQGVHYFVSNPPKFVYYPFQNKTNQKGKSINIDLPQANIPRDHKTLCTPAGEIYLIGGRYHDDSTGTERKNGDILGFNDKKFYKYGSLNYARSNHSLVELNGFIYIINGSVDESQACNYVERYNIETRQCDIRESSIIATHSQSCCAFNNGFIIKIGGMDIEQNLAMNIEIYDTEQNTWDEIDPHFNKSELSLQFSLLSNCCCCQISMEDIFIFGGYDQKSQGSKLSYILSYDDKKDQFFIDYINKRPLPIAEGFQTGQALIHNNTVYCLQNQKGSQEKYVLQFNGVGWAIMN